MFTHIASKSNEVGRVTIKRFISDVSSIFLLKGIKFLRKTILSLAKKRGGARADVSIFFVVLIGLFVRKSVF